MRDIKFRAKRTDSLNNEWIYGSYMDSYFSSRFGLVTAIFFNDYEICKTFRIPVFKDTVGQFTGLKDKNGKEIYEGDIVEITRQCIWEKGLVVFIDGCFFIKAKETLLALWECEPNNYELEVIGNIYENSNLLKGADNIE